MENSSGIPGYPQSIVLLPVWWAFAIGTIEIHLAYRNKNHVQMNSSLFLAYFWSRNCILYFSLPSPKQTERLSRLSRTLSVRLWGFCYEAFPAGGRVNVKFLKCHPRKDMILSNTEGTTFSDLVFLWECLFNIQCGHMCTSKHNYQQLACVTLIAMEYS
jgi:hypothetical protein